MIDDDAPLHEAFRVLLRPRTDTRLDAEGQKAFTVVYKHLTIGAHGEVRDDLVHQVMINLAKPRSGSRALEAPGTDREVVAYLRACLVNEQANMVRRATRELNTDAADEFGPASLERMPWRPTDQDDPDLLRARAAIERAWQQLEREVVPRVVERKRSGAREHFQTWWRHLVEAGIGKVEIAVLVRREFTTDPPEFGSQDWNRARDRVDQRLAKVRKAIAEELLAISRADRARRADMQAMFTVLDSLRLKEKSDDDE